MAQMGKIKVSQKEDCKAYESNPLYPVTKEAGSSVMKIREGIAIIMAKEDKAKKVSLVACQSHQIRALIWLFNLNGIIRWK